eukprot:6166966-Pyramimonas_sp.AAC.1
MTRKLGSQITSRRGPCLQKYPGGPTSTVVMRRARALDIRFWKRWQCGPELLPGSLTYQSAGVATHNSW